MIEVSRVTLDIGTVPVLRDVNVTFPSTGLVGIGGPNGSGKSCFLDILSGFRRPTSGRVTIRGQTATPGDLLQTCTRLHQPLVIPPALPVAEYLHTAANAHTHAGLFTRIDREGVASWLTHQQPEVWRLLSSAGVRGPHEAIHTLSWGQQRLVALSAVILANTPVVLLDEPLAGLAPDMRDIVGELLQRVAATRLLVVVEHDFGTLQDLCRQLLVLRGGLIVADLPPGTDRTTFLSFW